MNRNDDILSDRKRIARIMQLQASSEPKTVQPNDTKKKDVCAYGNNESRCKRLSLQAHYSILGASTSALAGYDVFTCTVHCEVQKTMRSMHRYG